MTGTVELGDIVKIHCTGRMLDGHVVTTTEGEEPLEFRVGEFELIIGLNEAVVGMKSGESRTVTIKSDDAFGPYEESLIMSVGLDQLPGEVEIGSMFTDDQTQNNWLVREVDNNEKTAIIDGNHFLAGKDLVFDISMIDIVKND
jgi:peptidylprolyl isomerase